MNGTLPTLGWCDLRKLKALVLSQNVLEGALPSCMANLSSLRILDLSDNRFTGDGASSTPLGNLTLLSDQNKFVNEPTSQTWVPKFQLKVFRIWNCETRELHNELPKFLYYQNDLGQFLYGPSGAAVYPKSKNDKTLNLSGNILESNIPPCLGNLNTDAFYLDLSFNQLSGGIPEEIAKFGSLQFLRLSNNRLTGKIPPIIFSFKSLNMLYLDGNNFDGGIPTIDSSTVLLSPLWALDLSNNSLSGEIPYWIGNFSALSILLLKGNYFTGEIPIELCKVYSLSIIDLSHNELYGPIPSCLSYLTLEPNENKSSASTNDISGFSVVLEGADYFGLTEFEMVDLEGYRPAIDFPETKDLRVERVVYSTKRGSYTYKGNILEYMSGIDLSCNRLTSEIPLQSIPSQTAQFGTFDESSYEANPFLCGPPLHKSCDRPDSRPTTPNPSDDEEESGLMDMYVFWVTFSVSYAVVLLVIAAILYINPYWRRAWFYFIERCIETCRYLLRTIFCDFPSSEKASSSIVL
ncbi:hypothetical protein F3Y22_tig00111022pilonHSYRG00053 [Hibiscus syriacus]|uniref:Uncharacterized protein n=1 Tax=Hibiscus syriacus TaxID=106335 RepID=A0A6A2Z7M1_HIBSY|nr:hypothetical protein F3Y22_tig00111022pilonHSYRG00053 [Hibiscus syriacus]